MPTLISGRLSQLLARSPWHIGHARPVADLTQLAPTNNSSWLPNGDGTFTLIVPAVAWQYGLLSPPLRQWRITFPAILAVDLEVEVGAIGVALVSPAEAQIVSGERRVLAAEGRVTVRIYVEGGSRDARLLLRNYSAADSPPRARVYRVTAEAASQLAPAEIKALRARESSFWYYSADLGDGVRVSAGLPDAPLAMEGHYKGRRILHWLLDRYFAELTDKRVLEPGCSGGFHTMELARRGAKVSACDTDGAALRQARFVADCLRPVFRHRPNFQYADFYDFMARERPANLIYCSGLLYHLPDIPRAVKLLADRCIEGAVLQTSISDLDGDFLEFANAGKYEFCSPHGEFAFVPSRGLLPKIFAWAGFRKAHLFDLCEFPGSVDEPNLGYTPGLRPDANGPVYVALEK